MNTFSDLKAKIEAVFKSNNFNRTLIGVTGPPGSGKSTTASRLLESFKNGKESMVKVIPMDGFHLSNEELDKLGLLPLKGIPDSFDATGFVELIGKLKTETKRQIPFPLFDRSIEKTIANADSVEPEHKLLIVEGNYLLYDKIPWNQIQHYLDFSIYLDVEEDILFPRLLERHKKGGKSESQAKEKVLSTDIPNARLIAETKHLADCMFVI